MSFDHLVDVPEVVGPLPQRRPISPRSSYSGSLVYRPGIGAKRTSPAAVGSSQLATLRTAIGAPGTG